MFGVYAPESNSADSDDNAYDNLTDAIYSVVEENAEVDEWEEPTVPDKIWAHISQLIKKGHPDGLLRL